jgi:glucosamine-6-phosphate deaminase
MEEEMQIRTVADPPALACAGADIIAEVVRGKRDAVLGLPTGNTPIGMYGELQRRVDGGELDVSRVVAFAIDEFAGVPRSTPGTNSAFYRAHLRLPLRALHIPNPDAREPEAHITAFADALRRAGGFDLCVLGIGRNGHIAFNEPGSERTSHARVVELTQISREAHAGAFGGIECVPARGLTLGIAELLASAAILVLATGAEKAAIVREAIEGRVGAEVPASWLQEHPRCTWLLDQAAASKLQRAAG